MNCRGGRKRFRRRYPKATSKALGEDFFQVPMKAREGAALVAEQERLVAAFEKIVAKSRESAGQVSKKERWEDALKEAEAMLSAIKGGLSEDDRREVLADELHRIGADPVLVKAVAAPQSDAPPVTMLDAKEMYRRERMNGADGRNQKNRLERVCKRLEASLGPLDKLPLVKLKREHGRKLRDHMLQAPAKGKKGRLLSPSSVRRELDMISAMTKLAITEFDLQGQLVNPFEGLSVGKVDEAPQTEWERRDPLPDEVLFEMRKRLKENVRTPELGLIWRILSGTGCRGAEVVGLRVEDVQVVHKYPHIWVRWHEDRRVKTAVSNRQVPLVGDALLAATEALKLADGHHMLFPRYAREAGPDAASQALMKHLRAVTKDPRHVVYSLRHNIKDSLVAAGVSERDENRILGHALGGLGDRVYGGGEMRLKAAYEAMEKALSGQL